MKAIFVIAFIFACMFCEINSLKCHYCDYDEANPSCDSQELVNCSEKYKFCGKIEHDWFVSIFYSEPPGHYYLKGCASEDYCTESGYYWWWGQWISCCQGDYCNK